MRKDGQFDESWSAEDRSKFEAEISRFESAWQASGPPDLAEFLPAAGDFRDRLWDELVAIDREYRNQRGIPADPASYERLSPAAAEKGSLEQKDAGDAPRIPSAKPSSAADTSLPGYTVTYRPRHDGELQPTRESTWTAGDSTPRRFGRFEIQKELGAGAMGAVYLAFDTRLQRNVALKFPKFSQDNEPGLLERFYREARSAATLRHPNICPVYDADCIDGVHFIAMAYIQGRLLSQFVDRRALPSTRNAALVVRKIALAVQEAHETGVVHRDLKPSNIMIDDRNEPIVMDFGLARLSASPVSDAADTLPVAPQADYGQTQFGDIIGTPRYMSPEQARGDVEHLGPASDIFSLGVIFYELLAGQAPFSAPGLRELLAEIVSADPVPPTKLRPEIPVDLERICLKMLSKKPADRQATMKQVAEEIRDALKGAPSGVVSARESVSTIQPSVHVSKKRRSSSRWSSSRIALVAGLACLLIGAGPAFLYWQSRPGVQTAESDQGPDGKKSEAIKDDGEIEVEAQGTGAPIRTPVSPPEKPAITDVAAKPIEKRATPPAELAPDKTYQLPEGTMCLALSPDNRRIAVGSYDRKAYLFDLELRKIVRTFGPHSTRVLSVDFSPNGTQLATGEDSKQMHVWNVDSGEKLHTFSTYTSSWGIKFSHDGKQLAGAGGTDLWNLESRASNMRLDGRNYFGTSVAFVPGSNELVAVDYLDGAVMLLDLATGKIKRQIATLGKGTRCVAVSPDGTRLAVAHGDGPEHAGPEAVKGFAVHVFERTTGKALGRLDGPRGVPWSVAFDPHGKWLACASHDGVVRLWHADSLKPGPALRPLPKHAYGVAFSNEGDELIALSWDGTLYAWKTPREAPPLAIAPFSAAEAKRHQQAWAKHLGVPVEYTNSIGMKFQLLPPGEYRRGSSQEEIDRVLARVASGVESWVRSEGPTHVVRITQPFYLGSTEVTQAQFEKVTGRNPSKHRAQGPDREFAAKVAGLDTATFPVEWGSWVEAAEFCRKLCQLEGLQPWLESSGTSTMSLKGSGYRLPTDAEWEFACRAGTTSRYSSGDSTEALNKTGWYYTNPKSRTNAVGLLTPNPFGLFDMHGNVWELCLDGWTAGYTVPADGASLVDPTGSVAPEVVRSLRGGSSSFPPDFVRSAVRRGIQINVLEPATGFRVLLPVKAAGELAAKSESLDFIRNAEPRLDLDLGRISAAGAKALTDWELIYVDDRDKVMVATADGTSPRPLADPPGKVKSLSMLGDASAVFACCDRKIAVTSSMGTEPWETVFELPTEPKEAFVSPDGTRIAWLKPGDNSFFELIVESLDGSGRQDLGLSYDPHWIGGSPDLLCMGWLGKWVLGRWDGNQIQRINAPLHSQGHYYPAPSPDGKYYAFSMDVAAGRAREIGLISRDGKRLRQFTNTGKLNGQASFSPDGRYIVFLRSDYASTELSIVDTDTRATREILRGVKYVRPVWWKSPSTDNAGKPAKHYEKPRPITANLAYQKPGEEFPKASASFTSIYDKVERANDGKVDYHKGAFQRWTSYSSPNDRDWLQIEFAEATAFSQIELAIYHERGQGVQTPVRYEAEYWEEDGWRPVSNPKYSPEQPQGNTRNTVTFDKIKSKKVRVVFTHRKDARSGVSEIAVWP